MHTRWESAEKLKLDASARTWSFELFNSLVTLKQRECGVVKYKLSAKDSTFCSVRVQVDLVSQLLQYHMGG